MAHPLPGEIVEDVQLGIRLFQQAVRPVTADKAGAAEDKHGAKSMVRIHYFLFHAVNPKALSCCAASAARSSALCERSQSARSRTPSENFIRGWYPSSRRAAVISPKQWRMSPARYLPVISPLISVPSARP